MRQLRPLRQLGRMRWRIPPAVLAAVALWLAPVARPASPLTSAAQRDDEPAPASTSYTHTLGPFSIDGANFTVKLSVI